jgi:hypothetical protein
MQREYATMMTEERIEEQAEERTPIDAYVIALDETASYEIDDADRPYVRQIHGVYVFDRNQRTHCCEWTPSYYLIHLYDEVIFTEQGDTLDEYAADELYQKYEYCGGEDCYVHCHTIERIIERNEPFTVYHYGDSDVDEHDADYDAQMDAIREDCCCNHAL